jgi:hypothetical protein
MIPVKLDSLPDYQQKYKEANNERELLNKNAEHILDLRKEIFKLWSIILNSDEQIIKVIDTRDEYSKRLYHEYTKDD